MENNAAFQAVKYLDNLLSEQNRELFELRDKNADYRSRISKLGNKIKNLDKEISQLKKLEKENSQLEDMFDLIGESVPGGNKESSQRKQIETKRNKYIEERKKLKNEYQNWFEKNQEKFSDDTKQYITLHQAMQKDVLSLNSVPTYSFAQPEYKVLQALIYYAVGRDGTSVCNLEEFGSIKQKYLANVTPEIAQVLEQVEECLTQKHLEDEARAKEQFVDDVFSKGYKCLTLPTTVQGMQRFGFTQEKLIRECLTRAWKKESQKPLQPSEIYIKAAYGWINSILKGNVQGDFEDIVFHLLWEADLRMTSNYTFRKFDENVLWDGFSMYVPYELLLVPQEKLAGLEERVRQQHLLNIIALMGKNYRCNVNEPVGAYAHVSCQKRKQPDYSYEELGAFCSSYIKYYLAKHGSSVDSFQEMNHLNMLSQVRAKSEYRMEHDYDCLVNMAKECKLEILRYEEVENWVIQTPKTPEEGKSDGKKPKKKLAKWKKVLLIVGISIFALLNMERMILCVNGVDEQEYLHGYMEQYVELFQKEIEKFQEIK